MSKFAKKDYINNGKLRLNNIIQLPPGIIQLFRSWIHFAVYNFQYTGAIGVK